MSNKPTCDICQFWKDPYLNILLYQNETTRSISTRLDELNEKGKIILQTDVIGLLQPLNDLLLERYMVKEYLEGIDTLCGYYPQYRQSEEFRIKKGWMNMKNRLKVMNEK